MLSKKSVLTAAAAFFIFPMSLQAAKHSSWQSNSQESTTGRSFGQMDNNEEAKRINVAGKAGFMIGSILGTGIGGYYKMTPHLQIGMSYASGVRDLNTDLENPVDRAILKGQIIEVGGRYFTGDSFAIVGGIGQRNVDFDLRVSSKSNFIATKAKGSAIVTHLGIGNFWTMPTGFTIGCEWIGMNIPVTSSFDSTVTENIGGSKLEGVRKTNEDLAKLMATTRSLQLLNFELGYNF
jgi:hypothetical protein